MMKNSIRSWLFIPVLCCFVFPLLVLTAYLSWQNYMVETEQVKKLQKELTVLAADNVTFFFHENETIISSLMRTNYLPDMSREDLEMLLAKLLSSMRDSKHGSVMDEIAFLDGTGQEAVRVSRTELVTDKDLQGGDASSDFRLAASTDDFHYSPIFYSEKTGEPLMRMSVAIRDLETTALRGVLMVEIKLHFLWNQIAGLRIGERGIAYMTDGEGRVVAHPNRSVVLKNTTFAVPPRPSIMKGIGGEEAVVAAETVRYGQHLMHFVTEIPAAEAMHHIRNSLLVVGIIWLFLLGGTIAMVMIITRQIIRPVEDMAETARHISRGDISCQAKPRRMDELGDLALAFNTMTGQLVETIEDLAKEKDFVKTVIESLTHPFYVIDARDYTIKLANSAANFGQFSPGDTCYKLTHQNDRPCSGSNHPCTIAEIKKTGGPVVVEHVHQIDEVTTKTYEIYGYPVYDEDGEVAQVIEYNVDITDKKNLEMQLAQSQKLEAVGILTGGVAHDFNNLLTTIIGYCEIVLMKMDGDDPQRKKIEAVFEAGNRAAGLTRQLLAFSRKQILEMRVVNLNILITNMVKMLSRLIGERIEIKMMLKETIGNILADPGQVEQIIMNLSVNARDAMPEGGKLFFETDTVELDEIYCRTHAEIEPGSYVVFCVTDTGQGMPADIRDHIFDPFFTTKEREKGTGLGLSTVYGIVKQMKGHIFVYSEMDSGTTFKIFFPVVDEVCDGKEMENPDIFAGGEETIMVVDDESSIRRLVIDTLVPLGYSLVEAQSGNEALDICASMEGRVDLLLTDVIMPGMNGRELAEAMGRNYPDMGVIYMSGYTDNIITHQGVLEPGLFFLNKPLVPSLLTQKIRKVLDEKSGDVRS